MARSVDAKAIDQAIAYLLMFAALFVKSSGKETLGFPDNERSLAGWWGMARKTVQKSGRGLFDSLVVLVAWLLWKERNSRVFRRVGSAPSRLADSCLQEGAAWSSAGFIRAQSRSILTV
ncbi:hypothetical protein ACP4OV_011541 [Aristida adscensionis]